MMPEEAFFCKLKKKIKIAYFLCGQASKLKMSLLKKDRSLCNGATCKNTIEKKKYFVLLRGTQITLALLGIGK